MGLLHVIKRCWDKLKGRDSRIPPRECQICCDVKTFKAFPRKRRIPPSCRPCIFGEDSLVCKACLVKAIMTKIEMDDPARVGCPVCPEVWKQWRVESIICRGRDGAQRIKAYHEQLWAVSEYEPPEDENDLYLLIRQGSRLCPYCARPFQRVDGCAWMRCGHCVKGFSIRRARSLQGVHTSWLERSTNSKDGIAPVRCK